MFSKKPTTQKEIGSLIGAGTSISGDVTFSGGLRIDGAVKGAVRCVEGDKGGMLVISEHGSIEGEVHVAHLVVAGKITGPVYASELVELQPKARVAGDVHYRALEMHNGAVVEGSLAHAPNGEIKGGLKLALQAVRPEAPRAVAAVVDAKATAKN
ncbi:MAG TPA: polymer-forming cytoskeletal protein [Burkholderiaceae bacterium]|nr:polymer-forming cytoskeletal protein [Burkholderiaceae bacterium]